MKKLALTAVALLFAGAVHAHEVLYNVTQVYFEPDTQWGNGCCNTVFEGSFLFNEHTGTVSGLSGILTESMTGTAPPGRSRTVVSARTSSSGRVLIAAGLRRTLAAGRCPVAGREV